MKTEKCSPTPKQTEVSARCPALGSSKQVLICEDEAIVRVWLRRELTRQGFDVVGEARDAEMAVDLYRQLSPDMVLMDIKMPKGDGISASIAIMGHRPVPIVILTAFGETETVARALEAGVSGYLVKPIEGSQILPALRMAQAKFEELITLRGQLESLGDALEQRKLVDRAKGILIRKLGVDEPGAHQILQRWASSQSRPIKEIALQVIEAGKSPEKWPAVGLKIGIGKAAPAGPKSDPTSVPPDPTRK